MCSKKPNYETQLCNCCTGADLGAACAAAARAAVDGAAATKVRCTWYNAQHGYTLMHAMTPQGMVAGAGRSSYVPVEKLRNVADPGAQGVAYWLAAVAEALQ